MPVTILGNHSIIWHWRRYAPGDVVVLPFKLAVELQARGVAI